MAPLITVRETSEGCSFQVRVHPGARRNAIQGAHADALKISLSAPPVDGRANEALVQFLAEWLGIPRARVGITAGHASRTKTVHVTGLCGEKLLTKLADAPP